MTTRPTDTDTTMDKQSLKKHHFWILLTLAVVLIPVALGGAVFGVGSAAKDKEKAIKQDIDTIAKASPKSDQYLKELETQKEELDKRRGQVWKLAYEAQGDLIRWPEPL